MIEQKDNIRKLNKRVNTRPLVINEVPIKECNWFVGWANKEFAGHYGFAFKWLCEEHLPPENIELLDKIIELEKSIVELKNKVNGSNELPASIVKMANGKRVRVRS